GSHRRSMLCVCHRHFDADLRQEVHGVFGAAVDLGVPFLAAVTLDFARGHSLYADRDQCVAHILELEWLDNGDDELHEFAPRTRTRYRRHDEKLSTCGCVFLTEANSPPN